MNSFNSENSDFSSKKKKRKEKKIELIEEVIEEGEPTLSPSKKKRKSVVENSTPPDFDFAAELDTSHITKKKKKKKRSGFLEDDLPIIDIEDDEHFDIPISDEMRDIPQENDFFVGWTKEELEELFTRMNCAIPKNDTLKYNSRVRKLNWDLIKFGNHSAEECENKWKFIEKKLRGYRILSELLIDAKNWLEKPWTHFYHSVKKNRHPDMPKRPLTSYMLFYMEKKKKYGKKHPNIEMSKLSKIMAEKFKNLPEAKKEKYNTIAATLREEYNKKMQKFLEEHPVEAKLLKKSNSTSTKAVSRSGPQKPLSPFRMFLQDKIKQLEGVKTQTDLAELQTACREKWQLMSNKKKLPWIRWAHEAEVKYLEEVKLYAAENPEFFMPPYKSVLTKKEKAILERNEGKPEKPPNSAYGLFSRIMLKDPNLRQNFDTPKKRLQEIARLWKEVPKVQKDEYAEKVKHLLEDYKMEYATYLETLPEDKREEELAAALPKKKPKAESQGSKKLKQMTINSVLKKLMPVGDSLPSKKAKSLDELIKMEPVHPPEDPFTLFKDEYLTNGLSEKKAVKAWKAVSSLEKKKYEDKLENLKHEYIVKFREFLTSLKPEELTTYSAYKGNLIKEATAQNDTGDDDEEEEEEEDENVEVNSEEESESSEEGENLGPQNGELSPSFGWPVTGVLQKTDES